MAYGIRQIDFRFFFTHLIGYNVDTESETISG